MGTSQNVFYKDFLPPVGKESVKSIKAPQVRKANRKAVNVEQIVPLLIRIDELWVRAWLEFSKTLPLPYSLERSLSTNA